MSININGINIFKPKLGLGLGAIETSLGTKIKLYKKRAQEVERYLSNHPDEWGKFQNEFNSEIDAIFRDIMTYEKKNLTEGNVEKVYKLKKLFIRKIRKLLYRKEYFEWSMKRPLGYAGDYKIIDDIYRNNPKTTGFERLFDNYFLMCPISAGVRNRKEDFKRLISNFIKEKHKKNVRIMSLACGPCRDILEMLSTKIAPVESVIFDCYDHDARALEYAKELLKPFSNVNFIVENVLRMAATKHIALNIKKRYDIIYSTGLFDYLNDKILTRLIANLKTLLKIDGVLLVSNVRDKYSNPSSHYMEWTGDWDLIYRDDEEFKDLFIQGGFQKSEIKLQYEQQGIMQYIIAINTRDSNSNNLTNEF